MDFEGRAEIKASGFTRPGRTPHFFGWQERLGLPVHTMRLDADIAGLFGAAASETDAVWAGTVSPTASL